MTAGSAPGPLSRTIARPPGPGAEDRATMVSFRSVTVSCGARVPRLLGALADVELQLPLLLLVAADARQLERADLGHLAVQVYGHRLPLALVRVQRRRQRRQLLDLLLPVLDDGAGGVVATHRRAEEAEVGRLADDQAELLPRHVGLGALLHAERHDAQRLDRRRGAGHRRLRRLDADVVGAG